jgi:hypothetical protein
MKQDWKHPWHNRPQEGLVPHTTVTQNYGIVKGFIECTFLTEPDGNPTGLTVSEHRYER